jgi:hypothetical protein
LSKGWDTSKLNQRVVVPGNSEFRAIQALKNRTWAHGSNSHGFYTVNAALVLQSLSAAIQLQQIMSNYYGFCRRRHD